MSLILPFFKYQGTGNDFILVEDIGAHWELALSQLQIARLCDRHFGIGADGLILMQKTGGYDFRMVYYNADGHESTFCGNGSRCIVAFAHQQGWIGKEAFFVAADGDHEARLEPHGQISIHMRSIRLVDQVGSDFVLNSGSPHYVRFMERVDKADLLKIARSIRYSDTWKSEGINVNLVELIGDTLFMRTYERGVEDETLSCGTGVTAAAIAWAFRSGTKGRQTVSVRTPGGNLSVQWEAGSYGYRDVWLSGPAQLVYSGSVRLVL